MKLVIVDYDMGNLFSVKKAFKRVGIEAEVSADKSIIESADKLLLPGVGHFKKGMENLKEKRLDAVIKNFAATNKPILGICLGMQLLTNYSEEGNIEGLGLIDAETKLFDKSLNIKIPHVGWNSIEVQNQTKLFDESNKEETFYFVHSYRVIAKNATNSLCKTVYGDIFDSGIVRDNIFGVQFHPEKSHKAGLRLLENFAKM